LFKNQLKSIKKHQELQVSVLWDLKDRMKTAENNMEKLSEKFEASVNQIKSQEESISKIKEDFEACLTNRIEA